MSITWEKIEQDWLQGLPVPYSHDQVLKAFEVVERRFGTRFFADYKGVRGTYIVTLVADLCTILEEADKGSFKLPSKGEIVRNIEGGKLHLSETLIRLAAFFLRSKCIVESEPVVEVDGLRKRPDLRIRYGRELICVEESRYDISNHQRRIYSVFERMGRMVDDICQSINIEIHLLKDVIYDEDIGLLMSEAVKLANTRTQPNDLHIDGFAHVLTYALGQKKPSPFETRPSLVLSYLMVGKGIECHLHVYIPFTDERILKLIAKSEQLPPGGPNLVILDLSVSGEVVELSRLAAKLLLPNEHRRIGGVIFLKRSLGARSMSTAFQFISHPNPSKPLPAGFIDSVDTFFRQNQEHQFL